MPKHKTLEEAYDSCTVDGYFKEIDKINDERIKSLLENAQIRLSAANIITEAITKKAAEWMNVYLNHYDALHIYTEVLLRFNKVAVSNHQCLFAFLCQKHSKLELEWDFFEKIHTKRNGSHYYGNKIEYDDWKEVEAQFKLYITTIQAEIKKKLDE